jgi:hypothetical protein
MGFEFIIEYSEHLQSQLRVTVVLSVIHAHCSSLEHVLSLLSLLCLQQCPLLLCSCSYQLAAVSQLTRRSSCPTYDISTQTAQKTPFLYCCLQLLPCKHACLKSRYSVVAFLFLLILQSLPSSGSACHNVLRCLHWACHVNLIFFNPLICKIINKIVFYFVLDHCNLFWYWIFIKNHVHSMFQPILIIFRW